MRVTDDPTTLVRVDAAAASGGDTVFASPGVFQFWPLARDGRYPVVHSAGSDATMWRISLVTEEDLDELATEARRPPLLSFSGWAGFVEISPDLRWLTYTGSESGPLDVFAVPLPEAAPSIKVSSNGGGEATWSAQGDGLFYRSGRLFYWVALTGDGRQPFGDPELFLEGDFLDVPGMEYAVSPDGERLLLLKGPSETTTTTLNVILNWFEELKRLIPN